MRRLRVAVGLVALAVAVGWLARVEEVSGVVRNAAGQPLVGAVVRIKATETAVATDRDGRFVLRGFEPAWSVRVTGWSAGHYVAGASARPWRQHLDLSLNALPDGDDGRYPWQPPDPGEAPGALTVARDLGLDLAAAASIDHIFKPLSERLELTCADCHPDIHRQWQASAHARGRANVRFETLYNGTDVEGRASPPTRYARNRDYGSVPLPPDLTRPYRGPGYKLDFPETAGNCASCHLPTLEGPAGDHGDVNHASELEARGVHCDYCHKVSGVVLAPGTEAPYPNRMGRFGYALTRPGENADVFFGPLDDVDFGRDTYLPAMETSAFCAPCHDGNSWGVPIYEEFREWQASPYAADGVSCQDCHMASDGVTESVAPRRGGVRRDPATLSTHTFPATAPMGGLLQDTAELRVTAELDGDRAVVEAEVTNSGAGHHLPTGSPLRRVLLVVDATDAAGRELTLEEGPVLPEWTDDLWERPGLVFAKVLEQLWTGDKPTAAFWTQTRLVEDTRIPARETRRSRHTFQAPAEGDVNVTARLIFRREDLSLARQKGWEPADVVMEEATLTVPGR